MEIRSSESRSSRYIDTTCGAYRCGAEQLATKQLKSVCPEDRKRLSQKKVPGSQLSAVGYGHGALQFVAILTQTFPDSTGNIWQNSIEPLSVYGTFMNIWGTAFVAIPDEYRRPLC